MKYATATEFIKAVDRIIDRKVRHYRTDWTELREFDYEVKGNGRQVINTDVSAGTMGESAEHWYGQGYQYDRFTETE